jgi:hypothetical protein
MTPETATSSHYFVCSTRRLLVDDPGFSTMIAAETAGRLITGPGEK